jgi:hypothetical protein
MHEISWFIKIMREKNKSYNAKASLVGFPGGICCAQRVDDTPDKPACYKC